jgi:glycosyltransferase involved in cell wall biosynthesis
MSPDRVFVAPLAAANHFHQVTNMDKITAVRQRYNIPEGNYFLSLAAPQPRKNLIHLIRCFLRLLAEKQALDVNLVLVGSKNLGWMYEEIFAAVEDVPEYRSRVIFTGYIPDEDLSEIYSGAKAFVFPSLYEGFGLPPLEAMQCGTPVITSNTTSLPEVVGDAGILVDPKDEDALCQAMLSLLTDEALWQELSQKGLERSKHFSWAKCAADTVEVYKTAIQYQ